MTGLAAFVDRCRRARYKAKLREWTSRERVQVYPRSIYFAVPTSFDKGTTVIIPAKVEYRRG